MGLKENCDLDLLADSEVIRRSFLNISPDESAWTVPRVRSRICSGISSLMLANVQVTSSALENSGWTILVWSQDSRVPERE